MYSSIELHRVILFDDGKYIITGWDKFSAHKNRIPDWEKWKKSISSETVKDWRKYSTRYDSDRDKLKNYENPPALPTYFHEDASLQANIEDTVWQNFVVELVK